MTGARLKKWAKRLGVFVLVMVFLLLFVVLPVGGSFLITNSFRFPDRGPSDPGQFGLEVEDVEFQSSDGIRLTGWWSSGEEGYPVIAFVHGLNRSRIELLERAAESRKKGYGVLLMDLRNHGASGDAYTTLGVHESRDVCAASEFIAREAPGRPAVLWGVSLGASTALLAASRCRQYRAAIADSAFLSFEETVTHHFRLIFPLPVFPIANMVVLITRLRMGFDLEEGDVEAAVRSRSDMPVLFVAGGRDVRMPKELAERLYEASAHAGSQLLVIESATHGQAFREDRDKYLDTAFGFLERVLPLPSPADEIDP